MIAMRVKTHTEEFKIRLTEDDAELLRALAKRRGVPAAVVARAWLREHLQGLRYTLPEPRQNGRRA